MPKLVIIRPSESSGYSIKRAESSSGLNTCPNNQEISKRFTTARQWSLLSHKNRSRTLKSPFLKIHFNIIHPFGLFFFSVYPIKDSRDSVQLQAARPSFDSWQGQEICLFSTTSRPALGPTQPPIQLMSRALSPRVKRPEREADRSAPSSTEAKNGGAIPPLSHMPSCRGA
jgi:hypothetical protein